MVFGTRTLALDLLSSVGYEVGPPWIRLLTVHLMDVQVGWDLGNFEARSMP